MSYKAEHIIKLCQELQELGINLEPLKMELILKMLDQEFRNHTKKVDPAVEFEQLLAKIKKQ